VTPQTGIRLGDYVTFEVSTEGLANSVSLILSNGQNVPLDRVKEGIFSKQLLMISTGSIEVGVSVVSMGQTKSYTGVAQLEVSDSPLVKDVVFNLDPQNPTTLKMSRSLEGEAVSGFEVEYGLEQDTLDQKVDTTGMQLLFTQLDLSKVYYFQITPLLGVAQEHGAPTDIYVYQPPVTTPGQVVLPPLTGGLVSGTVIIDPVVPTCIVKGIRVVTQKVGDKYYLVWDAVENATSYVVYMSDSADISTREKLLETRDTRYEYPFDHSVEENVYAYFRVEASCSDGQVMELTNAKKVQVGPMENVILLICLSLLIYAGIRLYRYAE